MAHAKKTPSRHKDKREIATSSIQIKIWWDQDTGPTRQATGPPRSDAGVGVGM